MDRIKYLDRIVYTCLALAFIGMLGLLAVIVFGGGDNPGNAAPGAGTYKARITDVRAVTPNAVQVTVLVTNVGESAGTPTCNVNLVTALGSTVASDQVVGKSAISPQYPQSVQGVINLEQPKAADVVIPTSSVRCV